MGYCGMERMEYGSVWWNGVEYNGAEWSEMKFSGIYRVE